MREIVITGAGGLVGLNLLSQLKERHDQITAIDKNFQRILLIRRLFPQVKAVCVDLNQAEDDWKEHFKAVQTLIQLHAQISALTEAPYWENNVVTIEKVVKVAKEYHCQHLIHTSSSVVISVSDDWYVKTKAAGEAIVVNSGLPQTVFRPPLMYGDFDYKHLGFLTALMEKLPLLPFPGNGKYIRQPLFVIDLCQIIIKAMARGPSNQVHNLIGKEQIYFIDLLRKIKQIRGIRCCLLPLPVGLFAFLVMLWGKLFGKAPFVKDQILALTAGDVFPTEEWEEYFAVSHTPFAEAYAKLLHSEYAEFRSGHDE